MVSFFGTETSPSSGDSSPTIIRKIVVLPAPLGPTRPTFSPGLSWNEASTKRTCRPYCLLIFERDITMNILRLDRPMIFAVSGRLYRHDKRNITRAPLGRPHH